MHVALFGRRGRRGLRLVGIIGCLIASTARADTELQPLNVRPGLWEMKTSGTNAGQMPIPDEMLAKLTPDMRAKMEAAMRAAMGPHSFQKCLTQQDIDTGLQRSLRPEPSCTSNVLTSTPTELLLHRECPGGRMRSMDVHVLAPDRDTINGTVHGTISNAEKTMTFDRTMSGRRLGADCGNVSPDHPLME